MNVNLDLTSREVFELLYLYNNKISCRYNSAIISLEERGFACYHHRSKRLVPIFEITFKGLWFAFIASRHKDLWSDDTSVLTFRGLEK